MFGFASRSDFSRQSLSRNGSAPRGGRRLVKAALFALACLGGLTFAAGEKFEARAADDGGMMTFLLGNSGGRARGAAPAIRFDTPNYRAYAPAARQRAHARAKQRATRAAHHASHRKSRRVAARHRGRHAAVAIAKAQTKQHLQHASIETKAPENHQANASGKVTGQMLALKAAAAAARPHDEHFRDRTLRRNDIVATASGLRVFLGAAHFPYRESDFAPISARRHIAQRATVEALDRTLRGIRVAALDKKHKHVAKAKTRKARLHKHASRKLATGRVATLAAVQSTSRARAVSAYAPTASMTSNAPALRAIERVVRRVDAPPPQRAQEDYMQFAAARARRHMRSAH
ncbi:MAG: hypothetical protein ACK5JM_15435 [Rhodoblastus sp.]